MADTTTHLTDIELADRLITVARDHYYECFRKMHMHLHPDVRLQAFCRLLLTKHGIQADTQAILMLNNNVTITDLAKATWYLLKYGN